MHRIATQNFDTNERCAGSGHTQAGQSLPPNSIQLLSGLAGKGTEQRLDWPEYAKIDAMTPVGNTNQAIGLQLGWISLVGGGPFPAPPPKDPRVQLHTTVIILMTDGLNTQDRWYTDQTTIDDRRR